MAGSKNVSIINSLRIDERENKKSKKTLLQADSTATAKLHIVSLNDISFVIAELRLLLIDSGIAFKDINKVIN